MKIIRPVLVTIVIGLLVVAGYFFILKNKPTRKIENTPPISDSKFEEIKADLNGDGIKETLRLSYSNAKEDSAVTSLAALDQNGGEIGSLPKSMPIPIPLSGSGKAYSLIATNKRQVVSFDFSVGPHSSETMFFGLQEDIKKVLPVCMTSDVQGPGDCLFWSGEVGELIAKDLDGDTNLEVVELVDEYPKDGILTTEEEAAIDKVFKDGDKVIRDGMVRIAKREKGGRGNKVVWKTYRFNSNIFEEQTGKNYDKLYDLASKYLKTTYSKYPTIMKRDAMSKDSLDYNSFVRQFWK